MSLETLFDREVVIRNKNTMSVVDDYGNQIQMDEDLGPYPAFRLLVSSAEQTEKRTQESTEFTYLLPLEALGICSQSQIVDGDETLEVIGRPEVPSRRSGLHHIEVSARLIRG